MENDSVRIEKLKDIIRNTDNVISAIASMKLAGIPLTDAAQTLLIECERDKDAAWIILITEYGYELNDCF